MALDINDYEPAFRYGAQAQTDDIAASAVTGAKLVTGTAYLSAGKSTNGTTAVDFFGTTNGFAGTITSVVFIPEDDANGRIDLYGSNGTVVQITKGSIGAVKGSVLANTTFTSTGTLRIVSTTAGNARVVATFTVA